MFTKKYSALVALLALVVSLAFSFQVKQEEKVIFMENKAGWIGLQLESIKSDNSIDNVIVVNAEAESPAAKAGIQKDDIIQKFAGKSVTDVEALITIFKDVKEGEKIDITLLRGKETKTVTVEPMFSPIIQRGIFGKETKTITVEPGEKPAKDTIQQEKRIREKRRDDDRCTEGKFYRMRKGNREMRNNFRVMRDGEFNFDFFGMHQTFFGATLMELSGELGDYFKSPTKGGMLVSKIEKGSSAEKGNLKVGDVLIFIGKDTIKNMRNIRKTLANRKEGEKLEVKIVRKEKAMTLSFQLTEADLKKRTQNLFRFDNGKENKSDTFFFRNYDIDFDVKGFKDFCLDSLKPHIEKMKLQLNDLNGKRGFIKIQADSLREKYKEIRLKFDKEKEKRKKIKVKVKKLSEDEDDNIVIEIDDDVMIIETDK